MPIRKIWCTGRLYPNAQGEARTGTYNRPLPYALWNHEGFGIDPESAAAPLNNRRFWQCHTIEKGFDKRVLYEPTETIGFLGFGGLLWWAKDPAAHKWRWWLRFTQTIPFTGLEREVVWRSGPYDPVENWWPPGFATLDLHHTFMWPYGASATTGWYYQAYTQGASAYCLTHF